ncbi:MAG: hypothetical protein CMO55_11320 [Verrucomicrobiales bacterium]|nr:hypothetical protein [Verrucomicrobiales bacterium]
MLIRSMKFLLALFVPYTLVAVAGAQEALEESDPYVGSYEVTVPEKYQKIWPKVEWFYRDIVWGSGDVEYSEIKRAIPDSIKHPLISPIFFIVGMIGLPVAAIWFLVVEFKVHLGWGFGQLGANLLSCILFVPGMIVAIVFACMNWRVARKPFTLYIFCFLLLMVGFFMVPSWTEPEFVPGPGGAEESF